MQWVTTRDGRFKKILADERFNKHCCSFKRHSIFEHVSDRFGLIRNPLDSEMVQVHGVNIRAHTPNITHPLK